MKTLLKISLLMNLGLGGCLVLLLVNDRSKVTIPKLPEIANTEQIQSNTPVALASTPAAIEPKPFRWEQLESSDYRVYIANLRQVGCPEQTIRDLITAEIEAAYGPRRAQLTNQIASNTNPLMRSVIQDELEKHLAELRSEESAVIATLLGIGSSNQIATTPLRPARHKPNSSVVTMPLVMREIDLSSMKLSGGQLEAITELRQSFVDAVGGSNQDSNDPAYRERWLKAQPEIDEMLKAAIGISAYQEIQAQASGANQN